MQNMHSSVGAADTPTRERFPHPASGIASSRAVCSVLPIASVVFLKTNSSCDSKRSPAIDRRAAIRFSRPSCCALSPCYHASPSSDWNSCSLSAADEPCGASISSPPVDCRPCTFPRTKPCCFFFVGIDAHTLQKRHRKSIPVLRWTILPGLMGLGFRFWRTCTQSRRCDTC